MKNKEKKGPPSPEAAGFVGALVLVLFLNAGTGAPAHAREPAEDIPVMIVGNIAEADLVADEAQLGESVGEPVEDAPVEGEPGPGEDPQLPPEEAPDDTDLPPGEDAGPMENPDGASLDPGVD